MKQNNLVIGLTGGSGSGKSIVARAACDLGFLHIDTDSIGHNIILKPNKAYYDLLKEFGNTILSDDGEINRKKLAEIVFDNPDMLEKLNTITHPEITKEVKKMLDGNVIIDGAVLYKTPDIVNLCDYIITVINSDERRIEFICNRDNIDSFAAKSRIESQPDNNFYMDFADIIIHSESDIENLYNKSIDVIKRCMCEKNT